ncbi:MAG: response regulator [Anaerolineae bacterium]|nr:response regulator [Anaerolineae bacterium]
MTTTVLIVEDEANIRKFASVNLVARGYDVVEADNARDGLNHLRGMQPDLLILDIRMPGMSGMDLLEIMSQEPDTSSIPVVVITASESAADSMLGSAYPHIAEVLIKPVSAPRLIEIVASVLKGN